MNIINSTDNKDYKNVAISFDWSIEQAKILLEWIDNDIFWRLIDYKEKDFWLFHLFTIILSKIIEIYWNKLKNSYSLYETDLQKKFLLDDDEITIFKKIILGNKNEVLYSTKKNVSDIVK